MSPLRASGNGDRESKRKIDSRKAQDVLPEVSLEFGKTNPSWGVGDKGVSESVDFVLAAELSHVQVHGVIHLWQIKNNCGKSLTNSPDLMLLEKNIYFNELEFFTLMSKTYGNFANDKIDLPNGFYYANHHQQSGGVVLGDAWTKQVEEGLIIKKVISINKNLN